MAQSVAHFGSGHDLVVREFDPHVGLCAGSMEGAWSLFWILVSLSLCPSLTHCLSVFLSLSLSKINSKTIFKESCQNLVIIVFKVTAFELE